MKNLTMLMAIFAMVAVAAFGSVTFADTTDTDLIANGGFEDPISDPDMASDTNWSPFAGGFAGADPAQPVQSMINPNSGASHLAIVFAGEGDAFAGVQQSEFEIETGIEYTLSFSALSADPNLGVNVEFRIEWTDANGEFIDNDGMPSPGTLDAQFANNVDITNDLTDVYQEFGQTVTAPANAVNLTVVLALQSFATGVPGSTDDFGTVFFDDLTVTIAGGDVLLGDLNGDGAVTLLDVGPFVAAISDGSPNPAADINCDGMVDLLDVGPFVDLLSGGP